MLVNMLAATSNHWTDGIANEISHRTSWRKLQFNVWFRNPPTLSWRHQKSFCFAPATQHFFFTSSETYSRFIKFSAVSRVEHQAKKGFKARRLLRLFFFRIYESRRRFHLIWLLKGTEKYYYCLPFSADCLYICFSCCFILAKSTESPATMKTCWWCNACIARARAFNFTLESRSSLNPNLINLSSLDESARATEEIKCFMADHDTNWSLFMIWSRLPGDFVYPHTHSLITVLFSINNCTRLNRQDYSLAKAFCLIRNPTGRDASSNILTHSINSVERFSEFIFYSSEATANRAQNITWEKMLIAAVQWKSIKSFAHMFTDSTLSSHTVLSDPLWKSLR